MTSKHSLLYFLGRGLPGLISFFAISIYTRLISPAEYGKYALVITSVLLFSSVFFQWLRLSLLRFLPGATTEDSQEKLYGALGVGYISALGVSLVTLLCYVGFTGGDENSFQIIALGFALLCFESLFEINLEYFRSNLNAGKYSIIYILKSVLSIGFGTLFAYLRFGAEGLIAGVLIADLVVILVFFLPFLTKVAKNLKRFDRASFNELFRYGFPLTISFAMSFIINSSDRYFINYYLGEKSTGFYSVGYDLSKQTLWVVMQSINLASYPLAIRALQNHGVEKAKEQLQSNVILLLLIAVPAAFGMAALADRISAVLIGHEFEKQVAIIIPFISLGALVAGFKTFYVDQSFQLGKKTTLQLWAVVVAAVVNVVLNIILIPPLGTMGALYSTIICYALALLVSYFLSKRSFELPFPWLSIFKIVLSAVIMAVALHFLGLHLLKGILGLTLLVCIGAAVYFTSTILLGVIPYQRILKILKVTN